MNEMQAFNFNENEVRTVLVNDIPYFVGKDVAKVLGYSDTNKAIAMHVDDEDKKLNDKSSSSFGQRGATLINESGLYSLVLSSKQPQAKAFKRWVTSEVLPSIRKIGGYHVPQTYAEALRAYANEVEQKEKLLLDNKIKDQQIGELKPKADYYDDILKNKGLVTITAIAKDYGMSGKKFNDKLHELGVQYKQSGQWFLYTKYQDKGYTHSETFPIKRSDGRPDVKMNTKWTQKRQIILVRLIKK